MRDDVVRFTANSAGKDFPPAGVASGESGGRNGTWKLSRNGERTPLPSFLDVTLQPGEALESLACGGGGYGDPLQRDPQRVAHRVREGWTSIERARDVYGVVLASDGEHVVIDTAATERQRARLAAQVTA